MLLTDDLCIEIRVRNILGSRSFPILIVTVLEYEEVTRCVAIIVVLGDNWAKSMLSPWTETWKEAD
jgi:hypothetical protein